MIIWILKEIKRNLQCTIIKGSSATLRQANPLVIVKSLFLYLFSRFEQRPHYISKRFSIIFCPCQWDSRLFQIFLIHIISVLLYKCLLHCKYKVFCRVQLDYLLNFTLLTNSESQQSEDWGGSCSGDWEEFVVGIERILYWE